MTEKFTSILLRYDAPPWWFIKVLEIHGLRETTGVAIFDSG